MRPVRAEAAKDAVRRRLMRVRHRGDAVQCPCCQRTFSSFVDLGGRANWSCPGCGAQNRHRMLAWYLDHEGVDLLRPGKSVLHFAPEAFLGRLLGPGKGYEYLSADLDDPQAMEHFDIQDIPHSDERFDTVVCSHVLEHVPDDRAAMRELWRVLRPGGTVVVLVPVDVGREQTFEDPTITTPEGRLAAFWQSDHVRLYGRDAAQRLAEPGFEIAIDGYVSTLPDDVVVRYGAGSPGMYVLRRSSDRTAPAP